LKVQRDGPIGPFAGPITLAVALAALGKDATGAPAALADVVVPDGPKAGETVPTTLLPFTMDGGRLGVRLARRLGAEAVPSPDSRLRAHLERSADQQDLAAV
jgi:hypothetical protein